MSGQDKPTLENRLDHLERRVASMQRWLILANLLAIGLTVLACSSVVLQVALTLHWGPQPTQKVGDPVTDDTPLAVGTKVVAQWGNQWWDAEVLIVNPDGKVKIHYPGWDSKFDEVVPRDRLRLPAK
jgi:hypothetical protein